MLYIIARIDKEKQAIIAQMMCSMKQETVITQQEIGKKKKMEHERKVAQFFVEINKKKKRHEV